MAYDYISTFFQVVSISAGWVVVHKLSETRDIERARRDMLSRITDVLSHDVSELLSSALKYHTSLRSTEVERTLKMGLQDISARTNLLSQASNNDAELRMCRSAILDFKKSVTAHHFEDEHVEPLSEGSEQIQLIAAEALRVKNCFLQLKLRQYPA